MAAAPVDCWGIGIPMPLFGLLLPGAGSWVLRRVSTCSVGIQSVHEITTSKQQPNMAFGMWHTDQEMVCAFVWEAEE